MRKSGIRQVGRIFEPTEGEASAPNRKIHSMLGERGHGTYRKSAVESLLTPEEAEDLASFPVHAPLGLLCLP